jgi:hypothetical protein
VHDVWVKGQKHETEEWYVVDMELIIYRENAPHGKHVSVSAFVDASRPEVSKPVLVKQNVIGIVPAETIGLHPVLPIDAVEMGQNELSFDPNPLVPYPNALLDEGMVQSLMKKQAEQQEKDRQASIAIGRAR